MRVAHSISSKFRMGDAGKMLDRDYLELALAEAREGMKEGGIPVSTSPVIRLHLSGCSPKERLELSWYPEMERS